MTSEQGVQSLADLLASIRVVPVLTAEDVDTGLAACQALQAGGIRGVEITLRTPCALDLIAAVKSRLDDFIVGAGTVKTINDLRELKELGVGFAVSPGLTRKLSDCAFELDVPLLPGIATASELMSGLEAGRDIFKLFPARVVGGIPLLKSFAAPFQEARFCPTGGIGRDDFRDYLALPNVVCVGGSWMVTPELLRVGDWGEIERLSRECVGL